MAAQAFTSRTDTIPSQSTSFARFGGLCGVAAGAVSFLYAVAFVVLKNAGLSALLLLVGGVLSTAFLTALYYRLREVDASVALWAFLLSVAGALGAAIHGGYDLANAIHPPTSTLDLPNPVDPRGLLTFGAMGLGLLVAAWLIGRATRFSVSLSYTTYLLAALLLIIYLGRLVVLTPTSPVILVPVVLAGFVVNPAWNAWLGFVLWRERHD